MIAIDQWAIRRELEPSRHAISLDWIAYGRPGDIKRDATLHRWFQNPRGWTRHGNPGVLTCEVITLGIEDVADLVVTARTMGLRFFISCASEPEKMLIELFLDTGISRDDDGRPKAIEQSGFDWTGT
jgi:hypothetical protein